MLIDRAYAISYLMAIVMFAIFATILSHSQNMHNLDLDL